VRAIRLAGGGAQGLGGLLVFGVDVVIHTEPGRPSLIQDHQARVVSPTSVGSFPP
jgi:hypothetical protein